jgi:hypothetical protein
VEQGELIIIGLVTKYTLPYTLRNIHAQQSTSMVFGHYQLGGYPYDDFLILQVLPTSLFHFRRTVQHTQHQKVKILMRGLLHSIGRGVWIQVRCSEVKSVSCPTKHAFKDDRTRTRFAALRSLGFSSARIRVDINNKELLSLV